MTNRELLEAAAKAAGIEIEWDGDLPIPFGADIAWNPLTDDSDALRLAMKLGMMIDVRYAGSTMRQYNCVNYWPVKREPFASIKFGPHDDLAAATRLAIVRAAAAMAGCAE